MSVTKPLRYQVLRRDNHTCRYCGATAPDAVLRIDHVIPVALGGSDQPDNLVTACHDCNAGKSATPADAALVADVAQDALRWRKALEAARTMALADEEQMRAWHILFAEYWDTYTVTIPKYKRGSGEPENIPLPGDWRVSISNLVADGMTVIECRDAIDVAMARCPDNRFSYFIGIVRNKLRARADLARQLMDEGQI